MTQSTPNPFTDLLASMGAKQLTPTEVADRQINDLLVSIFRFSVDKSVAADDDGNGSTIAVKCVSMADEDSDGSNRLSFDNLDQLLYERLMLADISKSVIDYRLNKNVTNYLSSATDGCEQRVLHYLYDCFVKIETIRTDDSVAAIATQQRIQLRDTVVNQSALILSHPEFDPNIDGSNKKIAPLLDLLEDIDQHIEHKPHLKSFIVRVFDRIQQKFQSGDEEITTVMALKSSYDVLNERFTRMSLMDSSLTRNIDLLNYFVLNENTSKTLLSLNEPDTRLVPIMSNLYQNTLFGALLSISCLPRPMVPNFEYFLEPSRFSKHEHKMTENGLAFRLNEITKQFHSLFHCLLKHDRQRAINWIETCLHSFKDRCKAWTNEMIMMSGNANNSSDGFMLNFSTVLLKFCKPFCIPLSDKLLKVDPRYCRLKQSGHLPYLTIIAEDSFLMPGEQSEINGDNFEPNFMTQCFVATHKALHLGFRSVHERFIKLVQDLNQMEGILRDMEQQSDRSDMAEQLKKRFEKAMTQFLSMKSMLSEREFTEMAIQFHISTAVWLNNLAINSNETEASKGFKEILPPILRDFDSHCLKSVPEFIMENVCDFIIYVRRFNEEMLALPTIDLRPLMTLIVIFMGSSNRMKNPHLRAKLAEMLEALMPYEGSTHYTMRANTQHLFTSHPLKSELIPTLLHVFVSIEISEASGEASVAFEQKFGYRRPMYIVLKYLWNSAEHRTCAKELADYAINNMEAITPPLFLRFINLLINDAIFLLDESFVYMQKLRELQQQRDSGEWKKLTAQQRQQNEMNYQHTGRIARFHNIIGRDTIHTLSFITDEIKTIFCDKALVDRVAAMLNYFLHHLVGPQKRNLKVKDLNQYEFKPKDIVHDICKMYVNLSAQDNQKYRQFCLAIGRDDRSYSKDLLLLASDVLIKSGFVSLSTDTTAVGTLIEKALQYQRRMEVNYDDAPEEFMDPIMGDIMEDPIILPNSGVRVERSTIQRHLLSDQTDPFTRSPLTMDMVVTDSELKERIKAYKDTKRKIRDQTNNS
ncbi:ubiquitin conjugation factor E4 A-like [Oppia nitens]|uniref:ubiquitin conjugation factor E4 A-like n=1 Tax=Oppia nitens TaxID=1686743 RepID=UPI0023DB8A10|nr:ubiquitin conjugation factor E4 A-like [Oppia nitens]